jgi:hypothetical protein
MKIEIGSGVLLRSHATVNDYGHIGAAHMISVV